MNPDSEITKELARGTFTDEMLANMRSRIGTEIRTDGFINNEVGRSDGHPAIRRRHR